jgi:CRISPR/Cas system endoribonuclease Cas6 (RAMP superfamily)
VPVPTVFKKKTGHKDFLPSAFAFFYSAANKPTKDWTRGATKLQEATQT